MQLLFHLHFGHYFKMLLSDLLAKNNLRMEIAFGVAFMI